MNKNKEELKLLIYDVLKKPRKYVSHTYCRNCLEESNVYSLETYHLHVYRCRKCNLQEILDSFWTHNTEDAIETLKKFHRAGDEYDN